MSLFSHPVKKLTIIAALAGGYVLGAKAGRERYEQIRRAAAQVKDDPRVQNAAAKAESTVADVAKEAASKVAATVSSVTSNDTVADVASDVAESEPVQQAAKHLGDPAPSTAADHIDVEDEIVYTTGPDLHDDPFDVESDKHP